MHTLLRVAFAVGVLPAIGCTGAQTAPEPREARGYQQLQQQRPPEARAPEQALTAEQVDADVDLLLYALDRGYGGRTFVPEADWTRMVELLRALRGQAASVEQLCNAVADALWQLPDAHLSAKVKSEKCGALAKAAMRSPSVGLNYAVDEKKHWYTEPLSSGHALFGLVAIKSLPMKEDPSWEGFDSAVMGLMRADAILIDLRANGGGDDSRLFQLGMALVGGPVATGIARVHRRTTPEAYTLWMNTLDAFGRTEEGTLPPFLEKLHEEARRKREAAAGEFTVEEEPPFELKLGPTAFKGPVAILVDEGCKSSCESGLEVLRLHPKAKVFGQRTAGFVHFGDGGTLTLPASGIRVGIPTKYNAYKGGKFYDKIGFEPDVVVPSGTDAFDPAMAWLANEVPTSKPVAAAEFAVPDEVLQGEAERLRELGLKVPERFPLEKPYAQPLTRRSYAVPKAMMRRATKRVFAPALRADLPALRVAMERAYGGWDVAEKHGWNWWEWFVKWDASLAAEGEKWILAERAFEPVRQLQLFQLDNHTTIPLGLRFGAGSRTAVVKQAPSGRCTALRNADGVEFALNPKDPGHQVRRARRFDGSSVTDAHYLAYPANRGAVNAVKCGEAWIEVEEVRGGRQPQREASLRAFVDGAEDRPRMVRLSDELAYLRLPSFYKSNSEIIDRESGSWPKPTGKEKALIIDLRGNEGGDAAFEALGEWIDPRELPPLLEFNKRAGASCLYHALRWGYATVSSSGLKPPLTERMRAMLQESLDDLAVKDAASCPAKYEEERTRRHYRGRAGKPRPGRPLLVVLVDNFCGSDCELMTYVLSKLPESVVVGMNTFGVLQFIQPGYSVLPNTKLPFRIALGTSDVYGDNRSTDGYGLDVDVLIDGDEAWTREGIIRLVNELTQTPGPLKK